MSPPKRIFGLVAALLVLALSRDIVAQTTPEPEILVVFVSPGSSGLDPAAVRRAIAKELHVTVSSRPSAAAAATLTVRVERTGELSLVHRSAAGRELTRVVDLPADRQQRLEVIALLAGNLARDEASGLAASLRPHPEAAGPSESTVAAPAEVPSGAPSRTRQTRPAAKAPQEPTAVDARADGRRSEGAPDKELDHVVANASLFFPLAISPDSHERRINFELGLAYSRVGAIEGVGINPFYLRVERDTRGAVVAGIVNRGGGRLMGAETAGIVNWRTGAAHGAQVAGIVNLSGALKGVQAAGVTNLAGPVQGVQASGVMNLARGPADGVQTSGVLNLTHGDVTGAQVAIVNVGANLQGVQVGVVNIAGAVRGVQAGVVNVADRVDGLSFGVVNVIKEGRTQAIAWSDTVTLANVGARYLMGPVAMLVGVGTKEFANSAALGVGVGAHLEAGRVFFQPDVLYRYVFDDLERVPEEKQTHSIAYRIGVGYQVTPILGICAGGGVEHHIEADSGAQGVGPYGFGAVQLF
jgi:hypothetical protein